MRRALTAHSARRPPGCRAATGARMALEPRPSSTRYGSGFSRATPPLSTIEYAAIGRHVSTAQLVAADEEADPEAGAVLGTRWSATTPRTTRAMPAAPSKDTASPNAA